MTFPTVVFGSMSITSPGTAIFTDGSSIPTGGFRLYVVPTRNMGSNGIDIGFTYINQFGAQRTSSITTAIAPNTTSGRHVQMVLEAGDTGIRDIMSVFINPTGGSTDDTFSFESWNEGIGRYPITVNSSDQFPDDRTARYFDGTPVHIPETITVEFKGKSYPIFSLIPEMYYSNPQIPVPITFNKSNITEFHPDVKIDISTITKPVNLADERGVRKEIVEWISETLSKNQYNGRRFFMFKSWLESVVGQVLSGYVQSVNGEIIKNAFSMILMSTTSTETSPGGSSTTADINPDTGLYQAFLKKVVYDSRYLIVKIGIKNIALEGAGTPAVVDGNQQLPIPYNLQFACPVKNCDFTITRKIT